MYRITPFLALLLALPMAWGGAAAQDLHGHESLIVVATEDFYALVWTPVIAPPGSEVLYRITMEGPNGDHVVEVAGNHYLQEGGVYTTFTVQALVGGEVYDFGCSISMRPHDDDLEDKVRVRTSCQDPSPFSDNDQ